MGIRSADEMVEFLIAFFSGVAVVLVAWAANRYFNRRRLYCIAPHVFEYSQLSRNSSVAYIQLQNAGKRSESSVQLRLAPGFTYELLASTAAEVDLQQVGLIKLERLTPAEQVGLLFLVEGTERFRREHVIGLSSDEVTGKIVFNASEVDATPPKVAMAIVVMFVVFGVAANVLFAMAKDLAWPRVRELVVPTEELVFAPKPCVEFTSNGKSDKKAGLTDLTLKRLVEMSYTLKRMYRRGGIVYAEVDIKNPVDLEIEHQVELKSPTSDSESSLFDIDGPTYLISGIKFLSKGDSRSLTVANYLPKSYPNQVVWVNYYIKTEGGYWADYSRRIYLGTSSAPSCTVE